MPLLGDLGKKSIELGSTCLGRQGRQSGLFFQLAFKICVGHICIYTLPL